MYTTKEVQKITGITRRQLQYIHTKGLIKIASPDRYIGNKYSEQELERIRVIKMFLDLDFHIEEIRSIMDMPDRDRTEVIRSQITKLKEKRDYYDDMLHFAETVSALGYNSIKKEIITREDMRDYGKIGQIVWNSGLRETYEKALSDQSAGIIRVLYQRAAELARISMKHKYSFEQGAEYMEQYFAKPGAKRYVIDWLVLSEQVNAGNDITRALEEEYGATVVDYLSGVVDIWREKASAKLQKEILERIETDTEPILEKYEEAFDKDESFLVAIKTIIQDYDSADVQQLIFSIDNVLADYSRIYLNIRLVTSMMTEHASAILGFLQSFCADELTEEEMGLLIDITESLVKALQHYTEYDNNVYAEQE